MPLYLPPSSGSTTIVQSVTPNVVTYESDTIPTGSQSPFDSWTAWYDKTGTAITSGEAAALLADMNLTYAGGFFVPTQAGIYTLIAYFDCTDPGSGKTNSAWLNTADYIGAAKVDWGDAPEGKPTGLITATAYERYRMTATVCANPGDYLCFAVTPGDTSLAAISFVDLSIMRLA